MIDSHCHLDLPEFEPDWQDVLSSAVSKGVERILIPGTTVSGWQRQQNMAADNAQLDVAFGLHPYFFPDEPDNAVAALREQLQTTTIKPVAIGEIGIDGAIDTPIEAQQALFEAQLEVACEQSLPVILHHRRSHHLLLESIKRSRFTQGGVIHAFSGSEQVARQYIDAGFKLGVGGTITYSRAQKTRQTVANIPLQHLLLETDAPDMPMSGRQGARNEPQFIGEVVAALAELHGITPEVVTEQTTANYFALFGSRTQCK